MYITILACHRLKLKVLCPQMVAIESKMTNPEAYLGWWGTLNRATCLTLVVNLVWGCISIINWAMPSICLFCKICHGTGKLLKTLCYLILMCFSSAGGGIKIFAAVLVYLTYPLNGFVPIDIIFKNIYHKVAILKILFSSK